MKSPVFEVKTTVSGDFNNHKTKYKAINSVGYIFSGTTNYIYIPFYNIKYRDRIKHKNRQLVKLRDYWSRHKTDVYKIYGNESVATPNPKIFPYVEKIISPHDSYFFEETYVVLVEDAIVTGGINIVFKEELALFHDLFDPVRDYTSEELHGRIIIKPGKMKIKCLVNDDAPEYVESAATFIDACAPNYAHWLTELLPRIAVFCSLEHFSKVPIVVNGGLHENIMESLLLVVGPEREIITLPADRVLLVDSLYVTSVVGYVPFERRNKHLQGHSHGLFSPTALRKMRDLLHSRLSEKPDSTRMQMIPEKIFLRRNSGIRKLLNNTEIESFLLDRGFVVIEPENLTFVEQLELFSKAKVIVGPTGAAFANLVFAPPGANIVILIGQHEDTCYWYWQNIACASGNKIIYGLSSDRSKDIHSDYEVRIETLSEIMDSIM